MSPAFTNNEDQGKYTPCVEGYTFKEGRCLLVRLHQGTGTNSLTDAKGAARALMQRVTLEQKAEFGETASPYVTTADGDTAKQAGGFSLISEGLWRCSVGVGLKLGTSPA